MTEPNEPAPPYTAPASTFPQPGGAPPQYPSEPPPVYEPPKSGYQQGYGPPSGSGYPPQGGYQNLDNPSYTQPVILVQNMGFGPSPKELQCPYCQSNIITATTYDTGTLTWLASGLLCLFGCWVGCCLIPFCVGDLQDVKHTCPNCNRMVGVYRRLD